MITNSPVTDWPHIIDLSNHIDWETASSFLSPSSSSRFASASRETTRAEVYCNRWVTADDATTDWNFTDHDRTAISRHTAARSIRTFAGYRRGQYTIDFTSSIGKFKHATLGLIPSSYRFDDQHRYSRDNSKASPRPTGGVLLSCDTGELVGQQALAKPYLGRAADISMCVQFVVDFTKVPAMLEIWYDEVQKGAWSFDELGLPNETVYPVYWGKRDSQLMKHWMMNWYHYHTDINSNTDLSHIICDGRNILRSIGITSHCVNGATSHNELANRIKKWYVTPQI